MVRRRRGIAVPRPVPRRGRLAHRRGAAPGTATAGRSGDRSIRRFRIIDARGDGALRLARIRWLQGSHAPWLLMRPAAACRSPAATDLVAIIAMVAAERRMDEAGGAGGDSDRGDHSFDAAAGLGARQLYAFGGPADLLRLGRGLSPRPGRWLPLPRDDDFPALPLGAARRQPV